MFLGKSDAIKAKSEQENVKPSKNQLKRQTMNNPNLRLTVMKSDGNIKLQNLTTNAEEGTNEDQLQNQAEPPAQCNNEIEQIVPSNSHNQVNETNEDESGLENVSQEALYDANSENNLSEVDILSGEQLQIYNELLNPISNQRSNIPVRIVSSNENERNNFPTWLLHLLQVSEDDGDSVLDTEPHFYSQGDGLGIHPSISEISTDSSDSTVQLPTLITTHPVIETVDNGSDNSDDYFSMDEVDNVVNITVENIVTNLQNFSLGLNDNGVQVTNNTPVTETSQSVSNVENKESSTNIPGSSSKQKD